MRNVKRKYRMHDKVYREKERQIREYLEPILARSRLTPDQIMATIAVLVLPESLPSGRPLQTHCSH